MKKRNRIVGFILLILIIGGILYLRFEPSDDFYYCKRVFLSDKDVYSIGDTIILTAVIIPEGEEKEIRIYEDFNNLDFHASIQQPCYPDDPDSPLCSKPSLIQSGRIPMPERSIITYTITPEEPYQHSFYGVISHDSINDIIRIDFQDFGYWCEFTKDAYKSAVLFGFSGIWIPIDPPIGASLEEFIEFKAVEIAI